MKKTILLIFVLSLVFFSCKSTTNIANKNEVVNTQDLFNAIKSNDLKLIFSKINDKNVNSLDSVGVSLLSRAILNKNFDIVKLLIKNGANPSLRNKTKSKSTPLMMCSNFDLIEMAKYLIDKGADIDAQDSNGDAVINWAAYMGEYDFTKMLLDEGVKTNQKSIHSDFAIDVALKEWQDSIVDLFIEYGKGTHIVKKEEKPIISAVKNNDVEFLKKNLNKQNSNLVDEAGNTLLIIASAKGNLEIVKLLLKNNALINNMNPVGHTAFNKAVWSKHNDVAKYLISQGANINKTDKRFGLTPLIAAARSNNIEIGKILLDKKVDVNITNGIDNMSPIMWATLYGNKDFIKMLLNYNPDLSIVSKYNTTVFDATRDEEILKLLNEYKK